MNITAAAIARAKELMNSGQKVGWGLKIGISSGGCSGLSYKLDFSETPGPADKVLEFDGLKVFVDPRAYLYLQNVEIGYQSDMMSSSFTFKNPDAKTTCGCGTSFSV